MAIGGKAGRLRAGGVNVRVSKSFLQIADKYLLYWCLESLHTAGVRNVILCADDAAQQCEAAILIKDLPFSFDHIEIFSDDGLGVHGLPFYVREHLGDRFIFECGHNITRPEHYHAMDELKGPDDPHVVFTAVRTHPDNRRFPLSRVDGDPCRESNADHIAFAHPLILDQTYANLLPLHRHNFVRMVQLYARAEQLRYLVSEMPPEFDIVPEFEISRRVYENWLTNPLVTGPGRTQLTAEHA
ncbi:hypothetical protein [Actinomadura sp. 3N407]|uniref:hypothetical protein n=1 Tax=Actinomadura sp. 3N407 TaxID=3457423 RepID=UPI003FCCDD7F